MLGHTLIVSSYLISLLLLIAQFSIGMLRTASFANQVSTLLLGLLALSCLLLLIAPQWTVTRISKIMNALVTFLANIIVTALLALLYVVFLVPGRLLGRRRLSQDHPYSAKWVSKRSAWDALSTTWEPKPAWTSQDTHKRGAAWKLAGTFYRQRNWLLLLIMVLLLILASLAAILSSPVAAPFIYPLF